MMLAYDGLGWAGLGWAGLGWAVAEQALQMPVHLFNPMGKICTELNFQKARIQRYHAHLC